MASFRDLARRLVRPPIVEAPAMVVPPEPPNELERARDEHRLIVTEYPYRPAARPFETSIGGAKILAMLAGAEPRTAGWLETIAEHLPALKRLPMSNGADDPEPSWANGMLPPLDGMMLYALIARLKPRTYLEVGSGNSTKFVRRAIQDCGLSTRIVSIDPYPRAGIDALCDEVIREPFENVEDSRYAELLRENDVVFIDNSHRSFQNSDVTVFFTEVLPALPSGVVYGIHDIFLPFDYPDAWADRFYNEQYLLVAYLLGGAGGDAIELSGIHVAKDTVFRPPLRAVFEHPEFDGLPHHGNGFWLRKA